MALVDDEALRSAIVDIFAEEGYRVHAAQTFEAAREAVAQARACATPGVLIVEPGLATEELEGFVRGFDDRASAPAIVILSDLRRAEAIAIEHQVVYVREPFDLEELVSAVERAHSEGARPSSRRPPPEPT